MHDGHEERVLAKIDFPSLWNACWRWNANVDSDGYGRIQMYYNSVRAHTIVWEMATGKRVPEGMQIDHLCKLRKCVNPQHLEVVTQKVNHARGDAGKHNKIKTHCPQKHEYSGDNLYVDPNGKRHCITCRRLRQRKPYDVHPTYLKRRLS